MMTSPHTASVPSPDEIVAAARFAFDPFSNADPDAWAATMPEMLCGLAARQGASRRTRAALVSGWSRVNGGVPSPGAVAPVLDRVLSLGPHGWMRVSAALAVMLATPRLRRLIHRDDIQALAGWPDSAGWDVALHTPATAPAEAEWLRDVAPAELQTAACALAHGIVQGFAHSMPAPVTARLALQLTALPEHPLCAQGMALDAERVAALVLAAAALLQPEPGA